MVRYSIELTKSAFDHERGTTMFRDPELPDWLEFVLGLLGVRW
jgi:hypothetical protein